MASLLKAFILATVTQFVFADTNSNKYSAHTSPSLRKTLDSSQDVSKLELHKEPRVELSGYLWDWKQDIEVTKSTQGNIIGFSLFAHSDLFASADSPAYWVSRNGNGWMVFNPHLYGEASAAFGVTVKLWWWHLTLNFKLMGIKFSPLDFQFAMDLNNLGRNCMSVGYFQEVFDVLVEVETDAYECFTGVVGWVTENDKDDCWWRKYRPQLPVFKFSVLDSADTVSDYLPWQCSDDSQFQTDERIDPETGEVVIHPHGWEPTNIDKGGDSTQDDAGKLDEGQEGIEEGWDEEGTTIWNDGNGQETE